MDFSSIKEIIAKATSEMGIEKYEIYYTCSEEMSTGTLNHELNAVSSGLSSGVGFRCIVGGHMGYASTSLFEESEIEELVCRAASNAQAIENDDEVFIFEGSNEYENVTVPAPISVDTGTLKVVVLDLAGRTYAQSDKVIDGTQCAAFAETYEVHLYNSNGLELSNRVGICGTYADAVVQEGEEVQDAFKFVEGLSSDNLEDAASGAVERALDKMGAELIETGKYNIVIDGKQMGSILSVFSSAFSAKNARLGMSLLAGKEGEMIASECVSIIDDPMRDGSSMQTPFDGEGVAAHKKYVIKNGRLETLLYDLAEAKLVNKTTTGNGQRHGYASQVEISPFNFGICAGSASQEQLFELAGNGIYVTEVKGLHAGANAVTGDFSIESAGFRIKDGKRAGAVKSFTIAGNFFEMIKNISELSNEVKWGIPNFTCFGSPDVFIKDISVAGK